MPVGRVSDVGRLRSCRRERSGSVTRMMSRTLITRLTLALLVPALALAFGVVGTNAAVAPTLNGAVGVGGATITLKKSGANVARLTAGRYTFRINDVSAHHNFHLFGPGVDRRTGVGATGTVTWSSVMLRVGTYTYVCDRHGTTMRKTFRVVAA